MLDLDRFKMVNDTYGHLIGDELLQPCLRAPAELVDRGDMVARLGGDEFAILQAGRQFRSRGAGPGAPRQSRDGEPFATSRLSLSIGATVGVAQGRRDGETAVELLQAADLALYAAKADGRALRAAVYAAS